MDSDALWQRKLLAYLHDPPCKALDIGAHESIALSFAKAAWPGWDEDRLHDLTMSVKEADRIASAADRFTFPKRKCATDFAGNPDAAFLHPFGGASLPVGALPTVAQAVGTLQDAFGGIRADTWKQRFFLYWRRWLEETVRTQAPGAEQLAYMPADTRIPDHTVWTHTQLTSALEACRVNGRIRPAFLMLQVGPVQEFIAQARSTRDLWSGSYLLSWLTATGIKAVTDQVGPDAVIFPALRGQGIFDILHREEVYEKISYSAGTDGERHTLWERLYRCGPKEERQRLTKRLLSPTLPNRFLAVVPSDQAAGLAAAAEDAVRAALDEISEACWKRFVDLAMASAERRAPDSWHKRWQAQVRRHLSVTWAAVPWEEDIEQALGVLDALPVSKGTDHAENPGEILRTYRDLATVGIPFDDRDPRYFSDKNRTRLNNPGFLWSANLHAAEFALAARRNTRDFGAFDTDSSQLGAPKDALTGKEEIIGDRDLWKSLPGQCDELKPNEGPYGAITLIKRLWCREETGYLPGKLALSSKEFRNALAVESVPGIAARNRAGWSRDTDPETTERVPGNPYVAVIAFDGDRMGSWVSGAKAPPFTDQLAPEAQVYFRDKVEQDLPRALTPSYHMQFSEALANVANHIAGRIVYHYHGQLIYAGGDDILAMVPADHALQCAQALRAAFRGVKEELPEPENHYRMAIRAPGFLLVDEDRPIIVPGPAADASCGIAVAHCKHPLQDIVQEAHAAESRAKGPVEDGGMGRAAMAVSLLKRGGETVHWGTRWDSGALKVLQLYRELRGGGRLSNRFPYALAALLHPYDLDDRANMRDATFNGHEILAAELEHVLTQQNAGSETEFRHACLAYLNGLPKSRLSDFRDLFLTAAFLDRDRGTTIEKGSHEQN